MPRLLPTCLAAGLALFFYANASEARPVVELTTAVGGAEASEYLVRVANPEAQDDRGVIELRRQGDDHTVARMPFEVPAKTTRYFRIPGDKGQRLEAVVITATTTTRSQDRFRGDGPQVVFDIPPKDEQRLHELRVHASGPATTTITHATFDETTQTPMLTRRAAVYDGVALILVPSRTFLALPAAERDAITAWVRTGGALGLSVSDESDLSGLGDLIGEGVNGSKSSDQQTTTWSGGRLHAATFVATANVGLGHVHLLPLDPWSVEANGDAAVQEKLVELAGRHRITNRFSSGPWPDVPPSSLDPNQGYRSVMALAGVLLVVQALVTAFVFRRRALRGGMGPAYRFVVGSSAVSFAAVVGLGIYAKGGFGARARELTFADAASGESVAWVERNRTYFASDARTIDVTPRDPSNILLARDTRYARTTLRMDDTKLVLGDVEVRPWQATAVTERGTTALGGGVRLEYEQGKIVVRNATGSTLRNILVSTGSSCFSFGDIANGEAKTSTELHSCTDLGPAWAAYDNSASYGTSIDRYLVTSSHPLTLVGQLEEVTAPVNGFRLEKRTTLLRVRGGAS